VRIPKRHMEAALVAIVAIGTMFAPSAWAEEPSVYTARCASCHGDDGKAETPVGRALGIASFEGSSFTLESLEKLLSESTSHAGLMDQLGEGDLDALVETLNALAAAS